MKLPSYSSNHAFNWNESGQRVKYSFNLNALKKLPHLESNSQPVSSMF